MKKFSIFLAAAECLFALAFAVSCNTNLPYSESNSDLNSITDESQSDSQEESSVGESYSETSESEESSVGESYSETSESEESASESAVPPIEEESDPNAELFAFTADDNGITVTGLNQNAVDLHVPAAINGVPVIKIAENAFSGRNSIASVAVADGVKIIGKQAFKNCNALESAEIPESVEFIGYAAFNGCAALKEIVLPFTGEEEKTSVSLKSYPLGYIFGKEKYRGGEQTVQYYYNNSLNYVDSAAYYIPSALKRVTVTGKGETHLPYDAFRSCESLTEITLGNKIASVGKFAFSCCYAEITWEDPTIERIDEYAYADYKGKNLVLPASIKRICKCAFEDCENLKELIVPDGVEDIDIFAFRGCTSMTKTVLGKGVKKLGVNAFYFCTALKEITLQENLEEICDSAFMSCKTLEKITLPENLRIIGKDTFKNCQRLNAVTFKNPSGWRYYNSTTSGEEISRATTANPVTAAYYLSDRYSDCIWERFED